MVSKRFRTKAKEVARFLTVMGNARRLSILGLLLDREVSAEEIRKQLGVHTSTLSQDMAKLQAIGSVNVRRFKSCVYYSSRGHAARELLVALESEYASGP